MSNRKAQIADASVQGVECSDCFIQGANWADLNNTLIYTVFEKNEQIAKLESDKRVLVEALEFYAYDLDAGEFSTGKKMLEAREQGRDYMQFGTRARQALASIEEKE